MKTLKGQAGAAIVEFALVISVLAVLLLGLTDFGLMWLQSHYIANAAREGARIAAKVDVNDAQVEETVTEYLNQFYGNVGNYGSEFVTITIEENPDLDGSGLKAARVSVTVQFTRFYNPPIFSLLNYGLPFFPDPLPGVPGPPSMTEEATFPYDDQPAP